jgi:hypothetical protein
MLEIAGLFDLCGLAGVGISRETLAGLFGRRRPDNAVAYQAAYHSQVSR